MPSSPPLIGALLRLPWEVVRERMLEGLHERGHTDLTAAHLHVLQYPGPDGDRPTELAQRTRMTKQALNYLLGQMEGLGYLERRDDATGVRRVRLTDRGQAVMRAIRQIVREVERDWERELGEDEFRRLRELLVRLNATLH